MATPSFVKPESPRRREKIKSWLGLAISALVVLVSISSCDNNRAAHRHQFALGANEAKVIAPQMFGTPVIKIQGWTFNDSGLVPPLWRDTTLSLRNTQLVAVTQTPWSDLEYSSWGSWYAGKDGQPMTLLLSAVHADVPVILQAYSDGDGGTKHDIDMGRGFHPSSVHVVVDSGNVDVTPHPDGSATITAPALANDRDVLWLWATSESKVNDQWVTEVRVGSLPWTTVNHVKTLFFVADPTENMFWISLAMALLGLCSVFYYFIRVMDGGD